MSGYLLCISFESGVPIFARKVGDVSPIPFPLVAALNGVKVFGKGNRVELLSTLTESGRVVWKDYHERITLIYAGTDDTTTDYHSDQLLNNVFRGIVFTLGLEKLIHVKNTDKLKKEFRQSYPIIDKILQGLIPDEKTIFGDLTGCADVILHTGDAPGNFQAAQTLLDSFMESIKCTYGCFSCNGSILVATKDWWTLSGYEYCMLLYSAEDLPNGFLDLIVYLPDSSPKLPFRFVVFKLSESIRLCLLCGQEPSFPAIEKEVLKLSKSAPDVFHIFRDPQLESPFPHYSRFFSFSKHILGFLIVNIIKRRCVHSVFPPEKSTKCILSSAQKLDILRTFYRNTVGVIFPTHWTVTRGTTTTHKALETYWSSEYHQCHAIQVDTYQLFTLYDSDISNLLMRMTSQKLLSELIKCRPIRL